LIPSRRAGGEFCCDAHFIGGEFGSDLPRKV